MQVKQRLEAGFDNDSKERQASGSIRKMLNLALKECCLLVLCATVIIAATRAYVGLFLLLKDNIP